MGLLAPRIPVLRLLPCSDSLLRESLSLVTRIHSSFPFLFPADSSFFLGSFRSGVRRTHQEMVEVCT